MPHTFYIYAEIRKICYNNAHILFTPAVWDYNFGLRKGKCVMFRIWAKIFKDNRLVKDTVICDDSDDTRTHKVFRALDEIIYRFDLGKPIWLDATVAEFQRHAKARFTQDNFVENVDFDYLELHVIEED